MSLRKSCTAASMMSAFRENGGAFPSRSARSCHWLYQIHVSAQGELVSIVADSQARCPWPKWSS